MTAARSRHAALSGSQAKAPGFAGGYLLACWPGRTGPVLISTNTGPSQAAGAARTGKPPADMPNPIRNGSPPHHLAKITMNDWETYLVGAHHPQPAIAEQGVAESAVP